VCKQIDRRPRAYHGAERIECQSCLSISRHPENPFVRPFSGASAPLRAIPPS
jgi:hypothetical protein